jgi:hypothetical protein
MTTKHENLDNALDDLLFEGKPVPRTGSEATLDAIARLKAKLKRGMGAVMDMVLEQPDITSLPSDDRFYFPATPPSPKSRTVVWGKGLNVALPLADFVSLIEVDEEHRRATTWGTVPFNALLEHGVAGHVMGIEKNRFYIRKEGWPSEEWVEANRVDN